MLEASMVSDSQDRLNAIFSMQAELNDHVFSKNEVRDASGKLLTMQAIADELAGNHLLVNDLPNQWLNRYVRAMEAELEELKSDLHWKWWSKDEIDLQNIRIELVDLLHFLVSAMLCAGLTPEKLFDIYRQKHAVNVARMDSGYSKATKTKDDNRAIQ